MNKLSIALLLAAGLFLIDVSPAAAHPGVDRLRGHDYGYEIRTLRRHEMPGWLRRNHDFRHWYRHTPLKRYRQIGWNQLFDIYRWERRYFRGRHYIRYDDDRHWKDRRRKDRHKRYRYDD